MKQIIKIRDLSNGLYEVEAEIIGKFGVHRGLTERPLWSVTLLAVGLAVKTGLAYAAAIELAKELDAVDVKWPAKFKRGMGEVDTKPLLAIKQKVQSILDKY